MVSVSPYSMKFAGYKITEGKISLDLRYKVRNSQLEGANQIVIDKLTLGERVESPDALKLPLELAIAILKDSEGRIELQGDRPQRERTRFQGLGDEFLHSGYVPWIEHDLCRRDLQTVASLARRCRL